MKKHIAIFVSVFLFIGCSSVDKNIQMKEELLLDAGDSKQLVEFYKSNLLEHPEFKVKLVNVYLDIDDVKSAELYRNTYNEEDLKQPESVFSIARIYYKKNDLSDSKKMLTKYIDLNGSQSKYHLLLGKVLARERRYPQAIEQFQKSRTFGVSDRKANNNIAVVYMMQGNYLNATQVLLDLYSDDPDDEKIRSNLILAAVKSRRPDIALDALKRTNSDLQARKQLAVLMKSISSQKKNTQSSNKAASSNKTANKNPKGVYLVDKEKSSELLVNDTSSTNTVKDKDELKKPLTTKIYRIQVFASPNALSVEYLNYLKSNYGTVYSYSEGLWNRYCVGSFSDFVDAQTFLKLLDIEDAFVVNYSNRKYIKL